MGVVARIFSWIFFKINRRIYWHQLPLPLAFLNLIVLRANLRPEQSARHDADRTGRASRHWIWNSISDNAARRTAAITISSQPNMGMKGTRFGRNSRPRPYLAGPGGADGPQPARHQPPSLEAREFSAGDKPQPSGRRLDSISGP